MFAGQGLNRDRRRAEPEALEQRCDLTHDGTGRNGFEIRKARFIADAEVAVRNISSAQNGDAAVHGE